MSRDSNRIENNLAGIRAACIDARPGARKRHVLEGDATPVRASRREELVRSGTREHLVSAFDHDVVAVDVVEGNRCVLARHICGKSGRQHNRAAFARIGNRIDELVNLIDGHIAHRIDCKQLDLVVKSLLFG